MITTSWLELLFTAKRNVQLSSPGLGKNSFATASNTNAVSSFGGTITVLFVPPAAGIALCADADANRKVNNTTARKSGIGTSAGRERRNREGMRYYSFDGFLPNRNKRL